MEHLAHAASLTSQAFQSTPSYREIVPNPSQRAAFLPWLFERNFWLRLGSESAYCVFDDDELVMFFMLEMPDLPRLTLWEMLRAGLAAGYFIHGIGSMRRLLATKTWFETREREVLGERHPSAAQDPRGAQARDRLQHPQFSRRQLGVSHQSRLRPGLPRGFAHRLHGRSCHLSQGPRFLLSWRELRLATGRAAPDRAAPSAL